jgi:hypothetical protein
MPVQEAAAQDPVGGAILGGAAGAILGGALGGGRGAATGAINRGRAATDITRTLVISSGPTERGSSFLQNIARLLPSLSSSPHRRRRDTTTNWATA